MAGVSQPTVSRALSGNPTVAEPTRKRIEAIARQLGYSVDKNASSLRRRATNTLALLFYEDPLPDESMINPFFLSMLGSITRTCASRGYDLLVSVQQLSSNWHVDFGESRKADGLILLGDGDFELNRRRIEQLSAQGTPFVRWGAETVRTPGVTVGCDNVAGGRAAAEHLIALGRTRVGFVGAADDHYPEMRDRYRGVQLAQRGAGLVPDPTLQVPALVNEGSGYEATARLLASGVRPDAICCGSDSIAIGAMRAIEEAGLSLPGDIAVVGFDDIPAAAMAHPPLTTVQQDYRRAGEVLVDTLLAIIRGDPIGATKLPARLIIRRSCGAT